MSFYNILIRPLQKKDALISYEWRNDPDIWVYTGKRPDIFITKEIEFSWIKKIITEPDSYRFAILVNDNYVGNIQITDINDGEEGEYHIFIGEKSYWGKGTATLATYQLIRFVKETLNLKQLYLFVNPENKPAIRVYEKCGFKRVSDEIKMVYDLSQDLKPIVSVFMMTYNHEPYIRQAIESILIQKTNFDFELVIGEDCSTDNTRSIIKNISDKYPGKFKLLLHEKNIGAVANQMALLSACSGKYIALCEGDDYWTDPFKLQKQIDFLESHPEFSMVFTNREVLHPDGKIIIDKYDKSIYNQKDILKGMIPATQTMMFRNDQDLVPFMSRFKDFYSGDRMLSFWASTKGEIYRMSDVTAVYRNSGEGAWSRLTKSERYELSAQSFYDFHKRIGMPDRRIFSQSFTKQHISILRLTGKLNFKSMKSTYKKLRFELSIFEIWNGVFSYLKNLFFKKIIGNYN